MANRHIPMFGLVRQYENLREEILDATDEVYRSGNLMNGDYTHSFEQAIGNRTDREYSIAVNSCSQALLFTLMYFLSANKLKHPRIIIPEISFVATANAPKLVGLDLSYCDVDYHGLIDLQALHMDKEAIGGIMYVNLCGNVIDYPKLKLITSFFSGDQPIIEDAAQSFGASLDGVPSGKMGTVSTLSFDPTKNLPNYSNGGMVLTDDAVIDDFIRNMRDNGKPSDFRTTGTNSRMSEIDCAQMLIKLKYFDAWQSRRKEIAEYMSAALQDYVGVPSANKGVTHAWSKYIIRARSLSERTKIMEKLFYEGVDCKLNYHRPLSSLDSNLLKSPEKAVAFCSQHVALPIYPELTDAEVDVIIDAIKSAFV